jgi:hypothetical protein
MKQLAVWLAALGAMAAVVVPAEGALAGRRMAMPETRLSSVEGLMANDPRVHTQEPVQGARCAGKECTPEPIDAEVLRGPDRMALAR